MKKILLSIVFALITLVTAFAADLNPFAYGLTAVYSKADNSVTISYSLNAPASKVKIVIYQDEANPATSAEFSSATYTTAGSHLAKVSLNGVAGGFYSYKIEVYGKGQASNSSFCKRIPLNSPFSIDIDNNMNSPYFGRTLVTQPTKNSNRGIYEFWPVQFTDGNPGVCHAGTGIGYYTGSESWFTHCHAQPLRVRILQDGSSKVFATTCDKSLEGNLWYVDPTNLNNWTSILNNSQLKTIVSHPGNDKVHNLSLDVRTVGNNIKLLLLSGTIGNYTSSVSYHQFETGYIYSGEYTIPKSVVPTSGCGTYVSLSNPYYDNNGKIQVQSYIKSGFLPVAINVSSQYDRYGGTWYTGFTQSNEKDNDGNPFNTKSGVKHRTTMGNIKYDYHNSDTYLQRQYTATGGFRYNRDSTKVIIANGINKTARVYAISQNSGTAHPSLTYQFNLGTICSGESNYITDFAWDHANNIYVVLRNGDSQYCGIYTFATKYDSAVPFVTKVRDGSGFELECYNESYQVTTTVNDANMGTVSGGGAYKSCTQATLTATPKDGYRFINWTIGGTEYTSNPLTIYVTSNTTVTANFGSTKYTGLIWKNLFKNGEDIADVEDAKYEHLNERLWRLYQVQFREYCKNVNYDEQYDRKDWALVDNYIEFDVAGFISERVDKHAAYMTASETNNNTPFAWLGDYIEFVYGKKIATTTTPNSSADSKWQFIAYLFFNRTDKARIHNNGGDATYLLETPSKKFSEYGATEKWRPWWTRLACGLPDTMAHSQNMPVSWTKLSCSDHIMQLATTYPKGYGIGDEAKPSWWHVWNTDDDRLLAWRSGGTTGPIVHHITSNQMELHASYVDKRLQESDPEPDLSIDPYDAKNNDVLSLLANDNHGSTTHDVTIDRKFAGGMYNTVCFPFDLPISKLPAELSGAEIRVFNGVTETYNESGDPVAVLNFITLQDYWQGKDSYLEEPYLQAGVPYLIMPAADVTTDLTYRELKQALFFDGTKTPYGKSFNGVIFQGVFNPTALPENAYILVADNRIAKVTDTSDKILGYRGYFVINDIMLRTLADQGNVYFSFKKPVTTSIPVAPEAEQQTKPEVRKVMYDGKIYILRGDEVYTITGHRVK